MRKNFKILLLVLLLVLIDQSIKILISSYWMDREINILGNILGFKPYINVEYSWINAISNMGVGLLVHVIVNVVLLLVFSIIFDFIQERGITNTYVNCIFAFVLAGGSCSLIDKVAWGGSLDYVLLKGFFIFDLKDVYLSVFEIMIILALIINYKGLRNVKERVIFKEFKAYFRVKYLKR